MRNLTISVATVFLLLGACASRDELRVVASDQQVPLSALQPAPTQGLGSELSGAVVRVSTLNGRVYNDVHFRADGSALIVIPRRSASISGRWTVQGDQLCLDWPPRGLECWPYRNALEIGRPVDLTSNRGQTVRVTMMSNSLAS